MRREPVDFFTIRAGHSRIHESLLNWSRCIRGGKGDGTPPLPMFRLYRAPETWHAPEARMPVDMLAGVKMEREVANLPPKQAAAVRWHYVYAEFGIHPRQACRLIAVSLDRLCELVHEARTMLTNRGA
jgi:hypothetical protein